MLGNRTKTELRLLGREHSLVEHPLGIKLLQTVAKKKSCELETSTKVAGLLNLHPVSS